MNLLISIVLSGIIGYIPYRILVYTGLLSENDDKNDVFKMILVSIETLIILYLSLGFYFNEYKINYIIEKIPNANFVGIFIYSFIAMVLMTGILNPLVILSMQYLINKIRTIFNLETITFIDKRDELFNNNKKPVFIVVRNFDDKIISEGALRHFNNQKSGFDLLEIQEMDLVVSELSHSSSNYDYHVILDLKQQIKIEIFKANRN
ncbi:hypothetical protein [Staphylococcus succinus]|uniref:hypothetical protein n=1 Tax=Staphylococcus succinus TaxID=61015 RepID=UPI0012EB4AFE|nr:hypothetical protein [Staphylococcus succinus]